MTSILIDKSKGFIYEQLYNHFKNEILNGNIKNNSKLPSKRQLERDLNISQSSIESAYNLLIDEGFIYSKERSGYYASDIKELVQIPDVKTPDIIKKTVSKFKYDLDFNGTDSSLSLDSILAKTVREFSANLTEDFYTRRLGQGLQELQITIAKYLYFHRGFSVEPSQIYIAHSTRALIYEFTKEYPEFSFALEDPGYPGIIKTLKEFNRNYSLIPLDEDGIDIKKIKSNVNIISVTPSHQFPTGIVYPIKRRLELISWASAKKNRFILEDDYDSEFRYTGIKIPALKSFDINDRVIYIGNFSKSIAPSVKTSYMVLPKSLKLTNYETSVSYINQKLLAHFINSGNFEKHLNRMRTLTKKKLNILKEYLDDNNIEYSGADAGMHLICDFKDKKDLILERAQKNSIKIYPISQFYQKKTADDRYILGFASISVEDLKKACDLLFKK